MTKLLCDTCGVNTRPNDPEMKGDGDDSWSVCCANDHYCYCVDHCPHHQLKGAYCCQRMMSFAEHKCPQHEREWDCPDKLIYYKGKEVGIIIHDGGSSFIKIKFCPWCGEQVGK